MLTLSHDKLRIFCLILLSHLLLTQTSTAQTTAAQNADEAAARQATSSILIRWQGKPGVERYRLQLATDARFNDIVFDQAVVGRQHVVRELTPGRYYWRVAPAAKETGTYSAATEIVVVASNAVAPAQLGGWRTATGEVLRPVSAQLRSGGVVDLVGVNREGTTYAIDGANGGTLWAARYRPDAGAEQGGGDVSRFGPVLMQQRDVTSVVVAFDGGVRALAGDTGREAWRASLEGRPVSGAAGDLNADGKPEVVVVTRDPQWLYVLDGATGFVLTERKLGSEVVGQPFLLTEGRPRGVALASKDGAVGIFGAFGDPFRGAKMTSEVTTAPLVVKRGGNALMVVGTREGLIALTLDELKPLGRIVPDADVVRGTLAAADVDGDGATEIVLLTERGRVALVSTVDGNVKWYAEGATGAGSAAFADVNTDGVLDVLVPGGDSFAVGFSGRDGSLVWKVEEPGAKTRTGDVPARVLVVAPSPNGGAIVVGSDPSRVGLRAVELPKGAPKKAAN
ncbi:MAG TPA: FG-GAP-like repeat-containing protein [Pyrinomonadaceae bacterium]